MRAYVALLRGVSPMNLRMPVLAKCLEEAGFRAVKTLLSSGNAVFLGPAGSNATIEAKVERALAANDTPFSTIIRPIADIEALLKTKPYGAKIPPGHKRVVTFVKHPSKKPKLELPLMLGGAKIVKDDGAEIFTMYKPGNGPEFMVLIEKSYGKDVTTRTWETVERIAKAGGELR